MRWDLTTGKLRAYGGFNLEAINHKVKVNSMGEEAQEMNYPNIYVEISMAHTNNEYSIDKITRYNYKNYYFTLSNSSVANDYHNDWDHFEEAPFKYTYEPVVGIDNKYLFTADNYTSIYELYYFGYISGENQPWNGDENTKDKVSIWEPITKENWKSKNVYFKYDKIIGLD